MKASARMQKNAAVSRALAAESMVLLKNTLGTLPLGTRVQLVGGRQQSQDHLPAGGLHRRAGALPGRRTGQEIPGLGPGP